jgi:hypothetical protein
VLPTLHVASPPAWPAATEPWYVIQARADVDGDGVFANAVATSLTPAV